MGVYTATLKARKPPASIHVVEALGRAMSLPRHDIPLSCINDEGAPRDWSWSEQSHERWVCAWDLFVAWAAGCIWMEEKGDPRMLFLATGNPHRSHPYPSRPVKQISHPGSPSLARRPGGEVKQKWTPLSRGFHAESRKEGRFKKAKPPPSAGFSRLLGRSPRLETGVGGTGY